MANIQSQKDQKVNILEISYELLRGARPIHWVKNLSLFAALIFSGVLIDKIILTKVFWAFISFNLTTSATYFLNDIFDYKQDRLHPIKKNRPIASGKLPINVALLFSLLLALLSFYLAHQLNPIFFTITVSYVVMQILYSAGLKNFPIIDILIIASGFILRVYAGAFIINAHLSVWFLLCVISIALFLASGKRRAELNIIEGHETTRKSLTKYPKELLNSYVTMFGNAAWMSWALYTFFESPKASLPIWLVLAEISRTTTINKLLMVTTPVVIFGIMRYEYLIFENRSEMPEKILLTDAYLISSIIIWLSLVIFVFFGGVASF